MAADRTQQLERRYEIVCYILSALILLQLFSAFGIAYLFAKNSADPEPDAIAVSLTILEILLAVAFGVGFWMIRSHVKDQAREQAEETAEKVAVPVARRTTIDWLTENVPGAASSADMDLTALMQALEPKGGDDDAQQ